MKRFWRAGLAVLIATGVNGAACARPLRIVLSSPLADEGADPDGCDPAVTGFGGPAAWQVRIERFLLDGKSLVETSREAKQNRLALCVADLPVVRNAEAELPFVPHGGGIAQTAGLVLRYADPQDFYLLEADVLAGRLSLMRLLNGERRSLASHAVAISSGQAHRIALRADGDAFAAFLDDNRLFEVRDGGIAAAGRFGIANRADSRTSFGDLFVSLLE